MKSPNLSASKLFLTAAIALGLVVLIKMLSAKNPTQKTDFLVEINNSEYTSSQQKPSTRTQALTDTAATPSSENDIQKCFTNYDRTDSLGRLRNKILYQFNLPEPDLDFEEYRLTGAHGENYRVHYDIGAPFNEVVRVYQIGADQLPDIVTQFPDSKSSRFDKQLEGALKLGTVERKILRMKSQQSLSVILEYEEELGNTISLHFINDAKELLCTATGCTCKVF